MPILGVKYHWVFAVEITIMLCLTGNMFGSATNSAGRLKKILLVGTLNGLDDLCRFSSEVFSLTGDIEVCANVKPDNHTECCQNFDCGVESKEINGEHSLSLTKTALSEQDVVLITSPMQHFTCMPSKIYNKTELLQEISECLNKGNMNVRLSQNDVCREVSTYDEEECKDVRDGNLILRVGNGQQHCTSCHRESKNPKVTINESLNSSNTNVQRAVDIMDKLPDLLAKIGPNDSAAHVVLDGVKGVLTKLQEEEENQSINVGITSEGDMKILHDSETGYKKIVRIPKEASHMAVKRNGTYVGVLLFPEMRQDNPDRNFLYDELVGIETGVEISNLSESITICFPMPQNGTNFSCVSWDGKGKGNGGPWITDGCKTELSNHSITCRCSHLTFFGILMSAPSSNMSASDFASLTYITSIGCGVSMFFLAAACFMHFVIRTSRKSIASNILVQLFVAMFVLNLSFLVNESIANMGGFAACVSIAAMLHYALLATFSWFFIQALHLYMNLWKQPSKIKHYTAKIYISGWIMPAVVVIPFLALEQYDYLVISIDDGKSLKMCWIPDATLQQAVNLAYYGVVFVFTLGIFIITVRQIVLLKAVGDDQQPGSMKANTFSILSLFLLMGLTWAFAFFSHGPLRIPFYYIFTLLNAFQGFFLFIYYYNTRRNVVDDSGSRMSTDGMTVITSPYQ